jgi:hypothetical protein
VQYIGVLVLLPVHGQQGVRLAFNQLFGHLVVLWWLCAAIGCSCGALLAVVAPYCCWAVGNVRKGAVASACAAWATACIQSTLCTSSNIVVAARNCWVLLWCAACGCSPTLLLAGKQWLSFACLKQDMPVLVMCLYCFMTE